MPYSTLLFDLDHTLLDSAASERIAFQAALSTAGIANPAIHFELYSEINQALWAAVERNEIGPDDVRVARFEQLVDRAALDADAVAIADAFVSGLGEFGDLYPGTRRVLDLLKGRVAMALVTNGIGEVQRARIARLDLEKYFDSIAISGELGTSKPGTAIFEHVFSGLGSPQKDSAVMIGDSLTSDVQGGHNFGIATCWFNPAGRSANGATFSHQIAHVAELVDLVDTAS